MKAIIYGSNGQDGHYLARLCQNLGVDVTGLHRGNLYGDLQTPNSLKWLFLKENPDYVFHLAANSTTHHDAGPENHATIANGTLNLLEAARLYGPNARIFLAGSAYQFRNASVPIAETDPWEPKSVYAAARCYSNMLARVYRDLGLRVYFGYFFHHDSPLRKARHISKQIAVAAREGLPIEIGDLSVTKEWTFAGDIAQAIWTLVNQDDVMEANLGTGIGKTVQEFVFACFSAANRDWREFVKPRENFVAEYRSMTCNPARIFSTGWRPKASLEQLAYMMVNE